MSRYILRRLLMMIPVILGVTILVCTIMYFVPGDPVALKLGAEATPEVIEAKRVELGLDGNYLTRLGRYMRNVFFHGDFGKSIQTERLISAELAERFPNTLRLAISSIGLSILIGIPLGVFAAVNAGKPGDYVTMLIALFGVSMPGFWLSLMMVLLFSSVLGWLPPYGSGGFEYWIMPVVSGALSCIGTMARQTRSSMLDVLGQDYIVMAKSKGMSMRKVIFKHALPNALIPVITVAGTVFGASLGGGMLIETIFSIPGIGYYIVTAVNARDFPVVQSSVLVLSVLFSIIILVTDLLMAAVDPRIKARFVGSAAKRRKVKNNG